MTSIVKFLVRRGTDSDRQAVTLADGELGFTKDANSRRLFVGDGTQPGGWPVASKFYRSATWTSETPMRYVQPGDMVFITSESTLFGCLSSPQNLSNAATVSAAFFKIANPVT